PVPAIALCSAEGNNFAGSENVTQAFRDASVPLRRPQKLANLEDLYNAVVIDSWLGNNDRNLGNVLAVASGERVALVMIDFEKSATFRPHPRIQSTLIEYRKLWPTAELGQRARELRPLYPPQATLQAISGIDEEKCRTILRPLLDAIGPVPWGEDSIGALASR